MRSYRSSFYRATAICVLGAVSVTGIGAAAHAAPAAPAATQSASVAAGSATLNAPVSITASTPATTGNITGNATGNANTSPIETQSRFGWIRDIIRRVATAAWEALKNAASRTWSALVNAWNSLAGWIKTAVVVAAQETVSWILNTIWNYFN